ncbi:MAG: hypothetical protein ACE5GY_06525 [Thermodesulfobacteriota bacterium]
MRFKMRKSMLMFVLVCVLVTAAASVADATERCTEIVSITPKVMEFSLDSMGRVSGPRKLKVRIERVNKYKKRCKKVNFVRIVHQDKGFMSVPVAFDLKPAQREFSREFFYEPYRDEELIDVCRGRDGKTWPLEWKRETVQMYRRTVFTDKYSLGTHISTRSFTVKGHVACPRESTGTGGQPAGGGKDSSTADGGAFNGVYMPGCDITGDWHRHDSTGEYLYWSLEKEPRLDPDFRNHSIVSYRVRSYHNGRVLPTLIGIAQQDTRSGRVNVVLSNTATLNDRELPSLKAYSLRLRHGGCRYMTYEGEQVDTLVMPRTYDAGSVWLYRPGKSSDAKRRKKSVRSGRPVVKGRRPGWIKDRRPALPDNRLEQIERRERQRGR